MSAILSAYGTVYVAGFFLTLVVVSCVVASISETLRQHVRDKLSDSVEENLKKTAEPKDEAERVQFQLKIKKARMQALKWAEGGRFTFIMFLLVVIQSLLWPLLLIEILATISMYRR